MLTSPKPTRGLRPEQGPTVACSYDPYHMRHVPRMKVGKTYDS